MKKTHIYYFIIIIFLFLLINYFLADDRNCCHEGHSFTSVLEGPSSEESGIGTCAYLDLL